MACIPIISNSKFVAEIDDQLLGVYLDYADSKVDVNKPISDLVRKMVKQYVTDDMNDNERQTSLINLQEAVVERTKSVDAEWFSNYISTINDTFESLRTGNNRVISQEKSLVDAGSKESPTKDFLYKAFKSATVVQNEVLQEFDYQTYKNTVIDVESETQIIGSEAINKGIKRHQNQLFNTVKNYLLEVVKDETDRGIIKSSVLYTEDLSSSLNGFNRQFKNIAKQYLGYDKFTSDNIVKYYLDKNKHNTLNAYKAFFMLDNYDALIKDRSQGAIRIIRGATNKFISEDKYFLQSASHNRKSWSDKELSPNEVLNGIVKWEIKTTPIYDFKHKVIKQGYMDTRSDEAAKEAIHRINYDGDLLNLGSLNIHQKQYISANGITSYKDLIAALPDNPMVYAKILMDALNKQGGILENLTSDKVRPETKDYIYSIYKRVFDDRNSILSTTLKQPIGSDNYYLDYVNSMLFTRPRTYTETLLDSTTNTLKLQLMSSKRANQAAKELGRSINARLGYMTNINYDTLALNYKPIITKDGEFQVKFPYEKNKSRLVKVNLKAKTSEFTIDTKIPEIELWKFCEMVLDIPFVGVDGNLTQYAEMWKSESSENSVNQLAMLALNVYTNAYVTHNLIVPKDTKIKDGEIKFIRTKKGIEDALDNFYVKESKLKGLIDIGSSDISLVGNATYNILTNLGRVVDRVNGNAIKSVITTADGNDISKSGITSLLDTMGSRLGTKLLIQENSPLRNLSILQKSGFLVDVFLERNAEVQDLVKAHQKWNPSEDFMQSFLYEYLEPICDDNELFSFYLADISDKTQRPSPAISQKIEFYFDSNGKYINKVSDTQGLTAISLRNLSVSQLKDVINTEMGLAFKGMISNIDADYRQLNEFIRKRYRETKGQIFSEYKPIIDSINNTDSIYDVYDNFSKIQEHFGKNAYDIFTNTIYEYNKYASENPKSGFKRINFTERAHYLIAKDQDGNNSFRANRLLFSQASRYGGIDTNLEKFWKAAGKLGFTYTDSEKFWETRKLELVDDLLRTRSEIDLSTTDSNETALQHLKNNSDWVQDEKLVIAKIKSPNGWQKNITKLEDLYYIVSYGEGGNKKQEYEYITDINGKNYLNSDFSITDLDSNIYKVELHPEIEKFNLIDTLVTQNYMLSSVGPAVFHDIKGKSWHPSDLLEEGAAVNAQNKRNVSVTATLKKFTQNLLVGIPDYYNIALVRDLKSFIYTIEGTETTCKPYDGATFVNPFVSYLENYSLGADHVGHVKKPIGQALDDRIGNDIFLKTASFPLTNKLMADSEFHRNMMRKMTDHEWKDKDGNIISHLIDISKGYNGVRDSEGNLTQTNILYSSYIRRGNRVYQLRRLSKIDAKNNLYERVLQDVNSGDRITDRVHISSNYELWQAYGGYNCVSKLPNGTWHTSEQSIINVVQTMNRVGFPIKQKAKLPNAIVTQSDIYQPMKHSDIHYVVTEGAMKNGAMNVNGAEFYSNNKDYNYGRMSTKHLGVQLDAEHEADAAEVSLMTQVMSSLASRGFTGNVANAAYRALGDLTTNEVKSVLDIATKIDDNSVKSDDTLQKLKDDLSVEIANSILEEMSSGSRAETVSHIMQNLLNKLEARKNITLDDIQNKLPYSDGSVFNFLLSTISSSINRTAIKLKFFGGLDVLNPSENILKTYNGKLLSDFKSTNEIKKLQEQLDQKYIGHKSQIELGKTYRFGDKIISVENPRIKWNLESKYFDNDGKALGIISEVIYTESEVQNFEVGKTYIYDYKGSPRISTVESKWKLDHNIKPTRNSEGSLGFKQLFENGTITNIREIKLYGKELGSYNVHFKGTDGVQYDIWDLDSVKNKYILNEQINYLQKQLKSLEITEENVDKINSILKLNSIRTKLKYSDTIVGQQVIIKDLIQVLKVKRENSQRELQLDLFNLSRHTANPTEITKKGFSKRNYVKINDKKVQVDLSSIDQSMYEIIMPMTFKTIFGLEYNDKISEIENDNLFFFKRALKNLTTQVNPSNFDVQLIRSNGSHLYLLDAKYFNLEDHKNFTEIDIQKSKEKKKLFRVDEDNNIIEQLSGENDRIFTDIKGNEIIVTDDINFYVTNSDYTTINLSNSESLKQRSDLIDTEYLKNSNYTKDQIMQDRFHSTAKAVLQSINDRTFDFKYIAQNESFKHLYNQSIKLHTSFLKSLEVVAARIPSQSQQSFMGMKVVGFTGQEQNNAYVSKWQIFLQGSDYDIDKVTLLSSCFNKNGYYERWSPYFRMENIQALHRSEELPFPTGLKTKILSKDYVKSNKSKIGKELSEKLIKILTNYETETNESFKKIFDKNKLNTKETLEIASILDIINERTSEIQQLIEESDFLKEAGYQNFSILPGSKSTALDEASILFVDSHNTYINKRGVNIENILKNFLVSKTLQVTKDAANVLESQTSVDDVTQPLRDRADISQFGQKDARNGIGNWFSKALAKFTNMQGKDGIAITASQGLKTFYALSAYYNTVLKTDPKKAETLLFHNRVLDNDGEMKLLMNAWVKNPERYKSNDNSTDIEKALDFAIRTSYNNPENAALVLSGIMSLATDNAKELKLSKLNAGADNLGMYLYGVMRGMKFNAIADVLTSDTARVINDLTQSNIFMNKRGMSVKQAIQFLRNPVEYISEGDTAKGIRYGIIGKDHKGVSKDDASLKLFEIKGTFKTWYTKNGTDQIAPTPDTTLFHLNILKNKYISLMNDHKQKDSYKIYEYKRAYDLIVKYIDAMKLIVREEVRLNQENWKTNLDIFRELSLGQNEIKRFSNILGLNQGLKVLLQDKFKFLSEFRNLISDRVQDIKDYNSKFNMQAPKLSIEKFVTDPEYRNKHIEMYGNIKHTFNILDALWTVPQYRAYLKAMYADIVESKQSAVFRDMYANYFQLEEKYRFKSAKDRNNSIKNLNRYLQSELINNWLYNEPLFTLPKGATVYSDSNKAIKLKNSSDIKLGTAQGNAAFINWMHNEVIPNIKQGIFRTGGVDTRIRNEFISNLVPVRNTFNIGSIESISYTLRGDLQGRTVDSQNLISRYETAFSKLKNLAYSISDTQQYLLSDLFTYYNFIVYKNMSSKDSLTKILKQSFKDNSDIFNRYKQYVAQVDKFGSVLPQKDNTNSLDIDLLKAMAPIVNQWQLINNSVYYPYVKVWDTKNLEYKLFRRATKDDIEARENYDDSYYEQNENTYVTRDLDWYKNSATRTYEAVDRITKDNAMLFIDSLPGHTSRRQLTAAEILDKGTYNDGIIEVTLDSYNINTIKYKGVTYDYATYIKTQETSAQDRSIPVTEVIYNNKKYKVIDQDRLNAIVKLMVENC